MDMILRSEEQKKAVESLLRIKPEKMTAFELNQAAAHLSSPHDQ